MTVDGYLAGFYYGDGEDYSSSTTFTEITGVEDVQPPMIAVDDIETKHLKTADHYKTYKAGWRDGGEVTATVQYNLFTYNQLAALVGEAKGWKVIFADDTVALSSEGGVGFSGYIKSLGQPIEADGLVKVSLTIKVSGKPVTIDPII